MAASAAIPPRRRVPSRSTRRRPTCSTSTDHAAKLFALEEFGNIYTRIMNPTSDVFEQRIAALEGGVGALALASGQAADDLLDPQHRPRRRPHRQLGLALRRNLQRLHPHAAEAGHHGLARRSGRRSRRSKRRSRPTPRRSSPRRSATRSSTCSTRAGRRAGTRARRAADRRQHAARRRTCCGRSSTAPTSSCTRRRSSSAATAPRSAASSSTPASSTGRSAGKFPDFVEPDPSYHGVSYTAAFGHLAYIIKARVQLLRDVGAALSPFNSWLFLQGLETLALRMERHSQNALAVAEFLEEHPRCDVGVLSRPAGRRGLRPRAEVPAATGRARS